MICPKCKIHVHNINAKNETLRLGSCYYCETGRNRPYEGRKYK